MNSRVLPCYGYSLTDVLISMQYPSGRQVNYALDAADRVTTVQNATGGGDYATVGYNAPGAVASMSMGNGVTQTFTWNDRVQPTQLAVAHSSSSLLTLGFFPCASGATTCASGNNGNLQSQTIAMPGLSLTQNYTYDHLNRLTSAAETGGAGWAQGYGYDVTGNRWVSAASPGPLTLTNATPQAQGWFDNCVNGTGATCAGGTWSPSSNNQVLPSEGWVYDGAGNVTQAGSSALTFTYDAENRQLTANVNESISTYAYDGNGLRVSKSVPSGSGTNTTISVYDAWGNEAAQYPNFVPASNCDTPTCYVTMDHLGSTRMLTDSAGNVQRRYDFLPFGQELGAGIGSRTTAMGYLTAPDGLSPKFTGQDRDQETSIDWFQVRSMSGAAGRFQSVDPANAGADAGDPQTWNGYSYVGNNPMSFTDPSGACWWCDVLGIGLDIAGIFTGGATIAAATAVEGASAAAIVGGAIAAGALVGGGTALAVAGGGQSGAGGQMPAGAAGLLDCTTTLAGCGPPGPPSGFSIVPGWLTGFIGSALHYGPHSHGTVEMRRSSTAQSIRKAYIAEGCPAMRTIPSGHDKPWEESRDNLIIGNPTQFQVGGFVETISSDRNNVVSYSIANTIGWSSLTGESTWGLKVGMAGDAWDTQHGPGHNVVQTFTWTEHNPCMK